MSIFGICYKGHSAKLNQEDDKYIVNIVCDTNDCTDEKFVTHCFTETEYDDWHDKMTNAGVYTYGDANSMINALNEMRIEKTWRDELDEKDAEKTKLKYNHVIENIKKAIRDSIILAKKELEDDDVEIGGFSLSVYHNFDNEFTAECSFSESSLYDYNVVSSSKDKEIMKIYELDSSKITYLADCWVENDFINGVIIRKD